MKVLMEIVIVVQLLISLRLHPLKQINLHKPRSLLRPERPWHKLPLLLEHLGRNLLLEFALCFLIFSVYVVKSLAGSLGSVLLAEFLLEHHFFVAVFFRVFWERQWVEFLVEELLFFIFLLNQPVLEFPFINLTIALPKDKRLRNRKLVPLHSLLPIKPSGRLRPSPDIYLLHLLHISGHPLNTPLIQLRSGIQPESRLPFEVVRLSHVLYVVVHLLGEEFLPQELRDAASPREELEDIQPLDVVNAVCLGDSSDDVADGFLGLGRG